MENRNPFIPNSTADRLAAGAEKLADRAAQLNEVVSDAARAAASKVDDSRAAAASRLEAASTALHENAESVPGGGRVSGLAHATADTMRHTADYVREHDVDGMLKDLETVVKNHPGPALVAAAFVGFLAGRALSNR